VECFTPYHGNEIIVWPSGTDNASPTFNATFFDAGEYIIQVNVTAKITHSGGSITMLNATGYIGGSQSDIVGNGVAMANARAINAVANGKRGPTRMVIGPASARDTYVEAIYVDQTFGTFKTIFLHHAYIKFNHDDNDTYGFWCADYVNYPIWDDGGQIMHPDKSGQAHEGHDMFKSTDSVFIARVRKICVSCKLNPPLYGLVPIFYVCLNWVMDVWADAGLGIDYIYPGSPPPPYASQIPPWTPSK
jgi:hypothetical protein